MSARVFSIFALNVALGSATVAILFELELPKTTVFIVLTCLCAGGSMLLLLLPSPGDPGHNPIDDETDTSGGGDGSSLWWRRAVLSATLWPEARFLQLLPIILYVGLTRAFIAADVPLLVDSNAWMFWMFSSYGTLRAIGPVFSGRLSDRIGRAPTVFAGISVHFTAYMWLLLKAPARHEHQLFLLVGGLFGLGDGVLDSQMYAIMGALFQASGQTSLAFANLNTFNSLSAAFSFFTRSYFSMQTKILIVFAMLVATVLGLSMLVKSGALNTPQAASSSTAGSAATSATTTATATTRGHESGVSHSGSGSKGGGAIELAPLASSAAPQSDGVHVAAAVMNFKFRADDEHDESLADDVEAVHTTRVAMERAIHARDRDGK